jgi:hypothetical protein
MSSQTESNNLARTTSIPSDDSASAGSSNSKSQRCLKAALANQCFNCSIRPDCEACDIAYRRNLPCSEDGQATAAHLHNMHAILRTIRALEAT